MRLLLAWLLFSHAIPLTIGIALLRDGFTIPALCLLALSPIRIVRRLRTDGGYRPLGKSDPMGGYDIEIGGLIRSAEQPRTFQFFLVCEIAVVTFITVATLLKASGS